MGLHRLLRESVSGWAYIWDAFFFFFNLVEWTDSATWGTPLLFWLWCPHQRYGGLEEHPHAKSLDSIPFADVSITEGEPKEDRTVNGKVDLPTQTLAIARAPPMPNAPTFEDRISFHHSHLLPLRAHQQRMRYLSTWATGSSLRDCSLPLPWAPCTSLPGPVSMRNSM